MASKVRAILPFVDSDGNVFNPSVSIPGDHAVVKQHPGNFLDADVSELELREAQGAMIAEAELAAKQSSAAQLAEQSRQRHEQQERDREINERKRREAFDFAVGRRLVADSRRSPMEAGSVHPDVFRAWVLAKALDARFTKKDDAA